MLRKFGSLAAYNILTPIAALAVAALATPAVAAGNLVIGSPAHDVNASGYATVTVNSSVDNATSPASDSAIGANATGMTSFTNSSTGTITATDGNNAIGFGGTMTQLTFTNNGTISNDPVGGAHTFSALYFDTPLGTFVNNGAISSSVGGTAVMNLHGVGSFTNGTNGTIKATGSSTHAVSIDVDTLASGPDPAGGAVTTFENDGSITATDGTAVNFYRHGTDPTFEIGSFVNKGTIASTTNGNAVNFGGHVGTFSNSGTMTSGGYAVVHFDRGVSSFTNAVGGVIHQTGTNTAVQFNVDSVTGGTVGTFENDGSIVADGNNAVGFYDDGNPDNAITSIVNKGTITGAAQGIHVQAGLGSFNNTGSVSGWNDNGIDFQGHVGSFTNSGSVTTASGGNAIHFNNGVDSFSNLAGGSITDPETVNANAMSFNGAVGTFHNAGMISSAGNYSAIYFNNDVTSFSNDAGGVIKNTNTVNGNAIAFNGNVGTFSNAGT
jgi:hypothetical protein